MAARRFRPYSDYESSFIPRYRTPCYDQKKVLHILVDLTMGAPVEITLKDSKEIQYNGYYLQFDRKARTIFFQPFGDSEVQEMDVENICTIRYSS